MMERSPSPALFEERLRGVPRWLGIVAAAAGVVGAVALLLTARRYYLDPVFWLAAVPGIAALIVAPLALALWELETEVHPGLVVVRLRPFGARRIPLSEVESCESLTYSGLSEHLGWGWRVGPGWTALTVPGSTGVRFTLRGGKRLLVSSNDPAQLVKAIRSAGGPA